jgi:hypothetical protein
MDDKIHAHRKIKMVIQMVHHSDEVIKEFFYLLARS